MTAQQAQELFAHVSEEELAKLSHEYSWSAPVQLYYLHALRNKSGFEEQALKAGILFNNSQWLNWQLHQLDQEIPEFKDDKVLNTHSNTKQEVLELPAFEPLHTVDYFASQGIKITEEPVSTDKLGKQLKSFTEWLKSMKKLHEKQAVATDPSLDTKIQQIAEGSNTEADVITEAMAEVLLKQGKSGKAIEVYEKLSLTDPSKSAYFAAQIERIKTS